MLGVQQRKPGPESQHLSRAQANGPAFARGSWKSGYCSSCGRSLTICVWHDHYVCCGLLKLDTQQPLCSDSACKQTVTIVLRGYCQPLSDPAQLLKWMLCYGELVSWVQRDTGSLVNALLFCKAAP